MKYKRFDDTIVVRIDRGEEILDKIRELALAENIKLASVAALGATNDFTVGVFNTAEKKYYSNEFKGAFEIVSLTGSFTRTYICRRETKRARFSADISTARWYPPPAR